MTLLLQGATVQRVDVGPRVIVLRMRARWSTLGLRPAEPGCAPDPWTTRFVIVAAGRKGWAVGLTAGKPFKAVGLPGGLAPEGEKMRLRGLLESARLEALGPRWVALASGEARFVVEAGERLAIREAALDEALVRDAALAEDEAAWLAEGDRLARELGESATHARKQEIGRALAKAKARIARRIEAVKGDLGRIGAADAAAAKAALFVAEAARAPRGARRLVVTDWSDGTPREVEMALDPSRPSREQVDAMFKRARRLKLGAAVAEQRLREAEQIAGKLDAVTEALSAADSAATLEVLVHEARKAAPRDFALAAAGGALGAEGGSPRAPPGRVEPSRPYRTFRGGSGERILVGRGAAHNDALSFRVARPHDLWLHAKGHSGAHVVVPLEKSRVCPSELLVDAAHLAAYFSDARGEGVVEVQHTPRRYLRKPRGSAPGLAVVDREKVTVLRVESDRISRLLATEEL